MISAPLDHCCHPFLTTTVGTNITHRNPMDQWCHYTGIFTSNSELAQKWDNKYFNEIQDVSCISIICSPDINAQSCPCKWYNYKLQWIITVHTNKFLPIFCQVKMIIWPWRGKWQWRTFSGGTSEFMTLRLNGSVVSWCFFFKLQQDNSVDTHADL